MEPTVVTQFARLKIPLEKILEATNNFADKNIIGKGGFGNVYKGQLIRSGMSEKIAARRLGRNQWQGDVEFWTEISMLSTLNSQHLVSLVGYCDEKGEKIIINRHYPKGSLVTYLRDPITLNWDRRLFIAGQLVDAICDIHYKLNLSYYVIHRNINSSTIVLDYGFYPKLSGFEHSIKHSVGRKNQIVRCEAIGTQGYMDPATEESGGVTHKSDIYSFGIVLFEILCGRKANEKNKTLLGPLARFHYENGTLQEIVHPDLWEEMKPESFKCFSEAAYSCIQEDRTQRPDAYQLYKKLQFAEELQNERMYGGYEYRKTDPSEMEEYLENMPLYPSKVKNMEHLRIEIRDILLATEYFNNDSLFLREGHSKYLWKVELECFDREHFLFVEGVNKDEVVKKHYTVMIKLINAEEYCEIYGQEYLSMEIEILGSCNHENIESFLGYSEVDDSIYLVSEFVSTSYLSDYLNDSSLTWEKRLRICIDVARGLNYLHNKMEDQNMVIHRNINSRNILLYNHNSSAKIVEFGLSVFLPPNQDDNTLHHNMIVVKNIYMDPEYIETGKLKRESDVFSFGVVMLEIFCGTSAKDLMKNEYCYDKDVAHLAQRWFNEGITKKKMTPIINRKNADEIFFLEKGPNKDSLDTFIEIMYECLAQKQNQRPTMEVVVKKLKKAFSL